MDLFSPKFLLVGVVALIVLGPERLPAAARTIGALLADYRRVSADLRSRASEAVDSAGLREPLENLRQPLQELRRPLDELRRPMEETRAAWSSASAAGAVVPAGPDDLAGPAAVTPDARVVVPSAGWTVWDGSTVDPAAAELQAAEAG
ncbi:MAG TPA: twin-arginine translocase TatA/TatE family subunit [Acidimicrobiales bacterium]|nr:twin-arginine translocase TatA/TatE family subunit [Acidimicrobiales bacterium]